MRRFYFIKDIIGRTVAYECEVCDIARKSVMPVGGIIYEDDDIIVYSHLFAPINGFIIIAPKQHVHSLKDLDDNVQSKILSIAEEVQEQLTKLNISQEFSTIPIEGEGIHARMYVLPRFNGIFESGFDYELLKSVQSMQRRNIPISKPSDIMLTTTKLKTHFSKKH